MEALELLIVEASRRAGRVEDGRGLVRSETDPYGYRTSYQWNAEGSRTSLENALGHRYSWEYNAANELVVEIDPLAQRVSHYYDRAARREATPECERYLARRTGPPGR